MPQNAATHTQIMGIVNATPDSFSHAKTGHYAPEDVVKQAYFLREQGADMVDIGAESTRPGATPLTAQEEWCRLLPVLCALKTDMQTGVLPVSVDTYHVETAAHALDMGVHTINDVSGLQNSEMCALLAQSHCGIIAMHSLGLPAKKEDVLPKETVMKHWLDGWYKAQMQRLRQYGISPARVVLDAGIGFGKTAEQSLSLLHAVSMRDHEKEQWLIGHSRKSFLTVVEAQPAPARDALTRAFSVMPILSGVRYLRVHDVAGHSRLRAALCKAEGKGQ